MIEIIPAIDLIDGECVRLYQGDYKQKVVYSSEPVEIAKKWQKLGAKRLHVVDLDGAKEGKSLNLDVAAEIVQATDLKVELGGGLRDREAIENVLNAGVHYAILGTIAVENMNLLKWAAETYRQRILLGIDARNGKVSVRGWLEDSDTDATELIRSVNNLPLAGVIFTDIQRDGAMVGPNIQSLLAFADASEIPVTASGGMTTVDDIRKINRLAHPRITSAIIGRALYEDQIDLAEAIEAGLEKNVC